MTELETLIAVREKIALPEHWTQGVLARDAFGIPVEFNSDRACSWCILGACMAVGGARLALRGLVGSNGWMLASSLYNDSHTHAEVIAGLDAGIEKVAA